MAIDISIIIPTYNRKELLKGTLVSLFAQDYSKEMLEIIVVDDGSTDGTVELLGAFKNANSNLRYFVQKHKGPASARNLGIAASFGQIVGFIDDDCVVAGDWARLMTEGHKSNLGIAAIGGRTIAPGEKTPLIVSQFLSTSCCEIYKNGKKEVIFFPTCNVSFKRWSFAKHKFNENFSLPGGEDLEFFWRLFKDGYQFAWNTEIKVIHFRSTSLRSFLKQAYIYGKGNFIVQHMHKDHPFLMEINANKGLFWLAELLIILKIPRFSYILGKRLIKEKNIKNIFKKFSIFTWFVLHKIFYIAGNISEFFRVGHEKIVINNIPRLLIFEITHSCNLTCRICEVWRKPAFDKGPDVSCIKKVIFQAHNLGIKEIALSGGEPLLRSDIFDIFEYARRIKIKYLGVLTNGILINSYREKLMPYLIDNTISLVISLDSLNAKVHNYLRSSDIAWEKTIESISLLSTLKQKHHQISFGVIAVILDQNVEEAIDLAHFVKKANADWFQVQPFLPNNLKLAERNKGIFWLQEERLPLLDESIDKLIGFAVDNPQFMRNSVKNLGLMKKYYRGQVTGEDVECVSADRTVLISFQGLCLTCFSSYGDVKKQDLRRIFANKERRKAAERARQCSWPCLLPCVCD